VVVTLRLVADGAGGTESDAAEDGALQRDLACEPPLADGAEPERRRRDPEDCGER